MSKHMQGQPHQTADPNMGNEPLKTDMPTKLQERLADMTNVDIVELHSYHPPGISEIIGRGGDTFIGAVDDSTVLKYPLIPGDRESIETEACLLQAVGDHPRIIASKGLTEHGLLLQRAVNGSLDDYMASQPSIPLSRKLLWCQQAAEALSYIHSKRVIHCDLNTRNLLLDDNLDLLLADFQGMLKSVEGDTLLDAFSRECSKSFMPRPDGDHASVMTDLFALGSVIYNIMNGHEVYPELDSFDDDEEISSRFQKGQFPVEEFPCHAIAGKCWRQQYQTADEVLSDIAEIRASYEGAEQYGKYGDIGSTDGFSSVKQNSKLQYLTEPSHSSQPSVMWYRRCKE